MTEQKARYPLDYSQNSVDAGKDRLREMADVASDKVKHATESAEEIASKVAEQAREYGEKAQDAVKNFKPYVDKSMKEQPMVTLGVAAAIGFVLGALWKK
jgi:ElaB/YqjD/DUF883 family membrane-anchored ribosome-binding protein